MTKIGREMIKYGSASIASIATAATAIPWAMAEREIQSPGGEMFLVPMAFLATAWLIQRFYDKADTEKEKAERRAKEKKFERMMRDADLRDMYEET